MRNYDTVYGVNHSCMVWCYIDLPLFPSVQTNPFDLFETFFGPSMGGFPGMNQTGFRTRRRSTVTKGEDLRWVNFSSHKIWQIHDHWFLFHQVLKNVLTLNIYVHVLTYYYWNTYVWLDSLWLSYDIVLEFSESIFGAEKEFELSHLETCEVCTGTGAKMGSKMRICSTCGGRGQVMRTDQTPFGLFSQVVAHFFFFFFLSLLDS